MADVEARKISRAEKIARLVVCRANDIDPEIPDSTVEQLFESYEGQRAVNAVTESFVKLMREITMDEWIIDRLKEKLKYE